MRWRHRQRTRTLPRVLATAVLGGLVLALGLAVGVAVDVGSAPVARAHDELVATTPLDGQSLESSPTVVVLEFAAELLTLGPQSNRVAVLDTEGAVVAEGGDVDGSVLRVAFDPLPDGAYEVQYRAASSDGHIVEGTTKFYVGGVPPATATPALAASDDPEGSGGAGTTIIVVVAVLAALLGGAVVARLVARARSRSGSAKGST